MKKRLLFCCPTLLPTMAKVDVGRVVSRYSTDFEESRKTITKILDDIRRFFVEVSKVKTTKQGRGTTRTHIEQDFPMLLSETQELADLMEAAATTVEQCGYNEEAIPHMRDRPFYCLSEYTRGVVDYVYHFSTKIDKPNKAAKTVIKHRAGVLALLKKTKDANKTFGVKIGQYLRSEAFKRSAADPLSAIGIEMDELKGTRAEKLAFLEQYDHDAYEEEVAEKKAVAKLLDTSGMKRKKKAADEEAQDGGEDDELDPEQVDAMIDEFVVDDPENAVTVAKVKDADFTAEELEDEEDEEENEDDEDDEEKSRESSSDTAAETSDGGALYDANLARTNAATLAAVARNSLNTNGKRLRNNKARAALRHYGTIDDEFRVDEGGGDGDDKDEDDDDDFLSSEGRTMMGGGGARKNGGGSEGEEEEEEEGEGEGDEMAESESADEVEIVVKRRRTPVQQDEEAPAVAVVDNDPLADI